jgi:disulfide bond formation protein DsbB
MRNYALPFCVIGLVIAIYHNLVYYRIIPESLAPCTQGVPCTSRQIEWLGFVTIPMMSLVTFVTLTLLLLFSKRQEEDEHA